MSLKPCPFCGNPGYIELSNPPMDRDTPAWFCGCSSCGYSLKAFRIEEWFPQKGYIQRPDAKDKAIEVWNSRNAY